MVQAFQGVVGAVGLDDGFSAEGARCSCSTSLTRSMGAVKVREKMAAMAPATAFRKASLEALVVDGALGFEFKDGSKYDDDDDDDEPAELVARIPQDCFIRVDGTNLQPSEQGSLRNGAKHA
mmetsp:Transcript_18117/g.50397  ORF Transcript_18117/g.50397 Transcript_18117/m.50397 type:complete len:122 (-) Transcript_18117:247-612(-)